MKRMKSLKVFIFILLIVDIYIIIDCSAHSKFITHDTEYLYDDC